MMIPNGTVINGEVYICTRDLADRIKNHLHNITMASGDDGIVNETYKVAYDHIIDLINHEERWIRIREENKL